MKYLDSELIEDAISTVVSADETSVFITFLIPGKGIVGYNFEVVDGKIEMNWNTVG